MRDWLTIIALMLLVQTISGVAFLADGHPHEVSAIVHYKRWDGSAVVESHALVLEVGAARLEF